MEMILTTSVGTTGRHSTLNCVTSRAPLQQYALQKYRNPHCPEEFNNDHITTILYSCAMYRHVSGDVLNKATEGMECTRTVLVMRDRTDQVFYENWSPHSFKCGVNDP